MKETGVGTEYAASGPLGEGRGERGLTEVRARSTTWSGESLLWPGSADGKRDVLGDAGRIRGELGLDGLAERPPGPPACDPGDENEVNAKLSLDPGVPSPLPEDVELMDALLPCDLCRRGGFSTSAWDTRTMVRRMVRERDGYMFTSLCAPYGPHAATDSRQANSLRTRVFELSTGPSSGVDSALILG